MIRDDLVNRKSVTSYTNPESFHISLHWIFDPMISFPFGLDLVIRDDLEKPRFDEILHDFG